MNQKSEHNYEIDFILVVNWFLNNSIISQTVRRLLILVTKKCRIYTACGVSQTPITLIQKRRDLDMIKMDYLRLLVDETQGKYIDWRNFL